VKRARHSLGGQLGLLVVGVGIIIVPGCWAVVALHATK
jgi:hypothetical protein